MKVNQTNRHRTLSSPLKGTDKLLLLYPGDALQELRPPLDGPPPDSKHTYPGLGEARRPIAETPETIPCQLIINQSEECA